ncbi:hypothetical protein KCV06_g8, partial [Aureobasidium melanogenum]
MGLPKGIASRGMFPTSSSLMRILSILAGARKPAARPKSITVDVAELVQCVDAKEHFRNVETSMTVVQNTGVVEESAEVTTGNILHGEVDAGLVLKSVEQTHQPVTLCGGENVALGQDSADFACVLLLRQVDLTVATLTDLSQNGKVTMVETSASGAELRTFASKVLLHV